LATVTVFFCSVFIAFIQEYLTKMSPEDSAILADMKTDLSSSLLQHKGGRPVS
jgi:hypothetical protein